MRSFLFIFILISIKTSAQVSSGARHIAMADAGTALEGVFSLGNNQAGIASIKSPRIALLFEEHFYKTDIRSFAILAVLPTKLGHLGLYASHLSSKSVFDEVRTGLTYAGFIGAKLAWSTTANYNQRSIAGYNSDSALSFDFGFQYHVTDKWLWGIHFANPVGILTNEKAYRLPVKLRLGSSYQLSDQVLFAMDTEYDIDQYSNFRLGLEYSVLNWLSLRGGASVNSFQHYVGIGIGFPKMQFDFASSVHSQLGLSPQFALSYGF